MKLKRKKSLAFIPIILMLVFFVFELIKLDSKNYYDFKRFTHYCIFPLIYVIIIALMLLISRIRDYLQNRDILKHGEKKIGYIYTVYADIYHSSFPRRKMLFYCLKVLVPDLLYPKVYVVKDLSYNNGYKYIARQLDNVTALSDDEFKLRTFPVDVYVKNGKYYVDVDSVKLD